MTHTPGLCVNNTDCPAGIAGRTLMVELGAEFLCPECGGALRPPRPPAPSTLARFAPALMAGAAVLVLVGGGLGVGYVWVGRQAAAPHQAASASPAAPPPMSVARPPAPVRNLAAPAPVVAPPVQTAMVSARPPLAPAPASAAAAPPVTAPAVIAPPVATASVAMAAAPHPAPPAIKPAPVAAPVPIAQLPDRAFDPRPVTGGAPAYPDDYVHRHPAGRVTVSCTIAANGQPAGCRALQVAGGKEFAGAALAWLRSGQVRFAPIVRHGAAVAETARWTLAFSGPSPAQLQEDASKVAAQAPPAAAPALQPPAAAQPPRSAAIIPATWCISTRRCS